MNFSSDLAKKANAGLVCPPRRLEAEPQLRANIQPIYPSGHPGALGKHSPMLPVDLPEAGTSQEPGERDANWVKRTEEARAKLARLRGSKRAQPSLGWLARDPSEWVGRKIRNSRTGKVYVVREVFVNGRVELEKSWMMYSSYVWTVRAEFETYS